MTEVLLRYLSEGSLGKIHRDPNTFMRTSLSLYGISLENPLVESYLQKNTGIEFIINAVQTTIKDVFGKLEKKESISKKELEICKHLKILADKEYTFDSIFGEIRAHFDHKKLDTTPSSTSQSPKT